MKKVLFTFLFSIPLFAAAQGLEVSAKGGICINNLSGRTYGVNKSESTPQYYIGIAATQKIISGFRAGLSVSFTPLSATYYNPNLNYNISRNGEIDRIEYGKPLTLIEAVALYRLSVKKLSFDLGATFGAMPGNNSKMYVTEAGKQFTTKAGNYLCYGGLVSVGYQLNKLLAIAIEVQPKATTIWDGVYYPRQKRDAVFLIPITANISIRL